MFAILGTAIPIGTYDSTRPINLGTNRWSFRSCLRHGLHDGHGERPRDEQQHHTFLTDNGDVIGAADARSEAPLYVRENHFTHAFNPKFGDCSSR